GDTTTVMATAMAAIYRRIDVGHVEAGLRTGDLQNPFPEEMNRVVAGRLARWHLAPTEGARRNLLRDGFDPDSIEVTGNTVIDALMDVVARDLPRPEGMSERNRMMLVTAHRRENFGKPFHEICRAIRDIADRHENLDVLYPVHPNPNVHDVAHEML